MSEEFQFVQYMDERMLPDIQRLVSKDLSEPYSIFANRYFLHQWPEFCICLYDPAAKPEENPVINALDPDVAKSAPPIPAGRMIGTIVAKAEGEGDARVGYIAMLAVDSDYRKRGLGFQLISKVIENLIRDGCREITLEAEACNAGALSLYERQGFMRVEKLVRYYLNGSDAYRLKLWVDSSN